MALEDEIKGALLAVENLEGRRVALWGTGAVALATLAELQLLGIRPVFFLDNSRAARENPFHGCPVLGPGELVGQRGELFIIIASQFYREIGVQLINMGFRHREDFIVAARSISQLKIKFESEPVFIGKYTYANGGFDEFLKYLPATPILKIGSFTSISVGVTIATNHMRESITTHPMLYNKRFGFVTENRNQEIRQRNGLTSIGNDVWIGRNVTIMPGITIGNGAIIGANAVVTRDVPDYAVAVGSPARVTRLRFSPERIELLNALAWWDWEDDTLRENLAELENPELFFRKFG